MSRPPLNGAKTHPLTEHAKGVLRSLANGPTPTQTVNPGVTNRLLREGLAEEVMRPSPFASHRGRPLAHLQITDAGRATIA